MNKLLGFILPVLILTSCTNKTNTSETPKDKEINMTLSIDNQELDVNWEDNDSVNAIKEILPLTINMHQYGGFEQTGSIGQSVVRNDSQINVVPGDIVLYNGNAISVFYNNSSWSYTRLGHINLDNSELNALLNKPSVTFVIKGEEK